MCVGAKAAKGVNSESQERDFVVQEGSKILWVVDLLGLGKLRFFLARMHVTGVKETGLNGSYAIYNDQAP
jgi:hypothetical protein